MEDMKFQLKINLKKITPLLSTLFFILIFNSNAFPFVSSNIRPSIAIICIYFWLINRPNLLGIYSIITIIIFEEALSSSPIGTNTFYIMTLYFMTNIVKKIFSEKGFKSFWYGFIICAFISLLVKWLIISIYYQELLSVSTTVFTFLTTITIFPIFCIINIFIYKYFVEDKYI